MKDINFEHLNGDFWAGYLISAAAYILGFFVDIQAFIYLVLLLVGIDMVTGIIAATKRKDKINSRRMARTVEKLLLYLLAIISAHAVKVVIMEAAPITYIVTTSIVLVEFKSIIENVESVTDVDIWSKIKQFFNSLKNNRK